MTAIEHTKKLRGFARLSPEQRKEMARKGGKSVPGHKRSFATNRELAISSGHKGGLSVKPKNRSFSRDHALASEAGKKGGKARQVKRMERDDKQQEQ